MKHSLQGYKNKFRQLSHRCKIGQGQLRVIIYINFVELEFIMLSAKSHDNRTISYVGFFFEVFLTYMGVAAIWSCDLDHLYIFTFRLPKEAPHKIWL